jgi:hypothetical protein
VVKLSVSLSDDDIALLDEYARSAGLGPRSAALQHAVSLLRHEDLEQQYAAAWDEWEHSGAQAGWEDTVADRPTEDDATR